MLHPAPLPEDRGGVAVPGRRRRAPRRAHQGSGHRRAGGRLHRRGHRRVRPGPRRVVLLPGDEHPAAGRAPGHRGGHRPGPGRAPAAHRRGRAAAPRGPRGRDHRPRHRGPPVRRGRPGRVPAGHRHAAPLRDPVRTRPAGGHRVPRRVGGEPALRRDAGQGHRARPHPRRRRPPAGPGPPNSGDPRLDHQPRPAGGHPARAGVPGRRHRHRVPDPSPARRPRAI